MTRRLNNDSKGYGQEVLRTEAGSWYWSGILADLTWWRVGRPIRGRPDIQYWPSTTYVHDVETATLYAARRETERITRERRQRERGQYADAG